MEKLLRKVYSSKGAKACLIAASELSAAASVAAYCAMLFLAFRSSIPEGLVVLFSAALPFLLVTLVRRSINAPRPYELYDFYERPPKSRTGLSFPSRHAYSAFAIASLAFAFNLPVAIALSALALCLAVARVLLGIHFVRDVLCGGIIGIISGAFGILMLTVL